MDNREKTALALLGLTGVAAAAWFAKEAADEKKRQETPTAADPTPGEGPVPAADYGMDPLEETEPPAPEEIYVPEPIPAEFAEPPPRVNVGTTYLNAQEMLAILNSRGTRPLPYTINQAGNVINFGAIEVLQVPERVLGMHGALHCSLVADNNRFLIYKDGSFWMTSTSHNIYNAAIIEALTHL